MSYFDEQDSYRRELDRYLAQKAILAGGLFVLIVLGVVISIYYLITHL